MALELTAEAAVRLAATIVQALSVVPDDLTGLDGATRGLLERLASAVPAGQPEQDPVPFMS